MQLHNLSADEHSEGSPTLYSMPQLATHQLLYTMPTHMYPNDHCGMPDSTVAPPFRTKRRQVKNACVNCQKACKKCDDARPCLRCVKYGISEDCVDSTRKARKKGVKRGPYKKRGSKGATAELDGAHRSKHRVNHNIPELQILPVPELVSVAGPYSLTVSSPYQTGETYAYPPPPPVSKAATYYNDFYVDSPQDAHNIPPPALQKSSSFTNPSASSSPYSNQYSRHGHLRDASQGKHPSQSQQPIYEPQRHSHQSYARDPVVVLRDSSQREQRHHREQTYSPVAQLPGPRVYNEQAAHAHEIRQSSHAHHQARQIEQVEVQLGQAVAYPPPPSPPSVVEQQQQQQHQVQLRSNRQSHQQPLQHHAPQSQSRTIPSSHPQSSSQHYYPSQHQQYVQYESSPQYTETVPAYYSKPTITQYGRVHAGHGYDGRS